MAAVIFFVALAAALFSLVVWALFPRDNEFPDLNETAMWREIADALNRPTKDMK